jgi:putative ABC transport system substrate-binding protein
MLRLAVAVVSLVVSLGVSLVAGSFPLMAQQAKAKLVFVAFSRLPAYEASFDSTLRGLGWEEGRNLLMERHYIRSATPLSEVAVEAVRRAPDVIVVPSAGIATAVRLETTSIPIVVLAAGELVGAGLAETLARPGGNVTGTQIVQRDLMGKRLQLLNEALPQLTRIAALQETTTVLSAMRADNRKAFESAARALQLAPLWYEVPGVGDLEDRFRTMARQQAHAVIVIGSPFMLQNARLLTQLAAKYHIPATYETKDFVHADGLMSYGVDFVDVFARGAAFVDKILRGAKPGLLPIEQPTKFEFSINLKTAKALGLTIPQSVLLRADEVIQ